MVGFKSLGLAGARKATDKFLHLFRRSSPTNATATSSSSQNAEEAAHQEKRSHSSPEANRASKDPNVNAHDLSNNMADEPEKIAAGDKENESPCLAGVTKGVTAPEAGEDETQPASTLPVHEDAAEAAERAEHLRFIGEALEMVS